MNLAMVHWNFFHCLAIAQNGVSAPTRLLPPVGETVLPTLIPTDLGAHTQPIVT